MYNDRDTRSLSESEVLEDCHRHRSVWCAHRQLLHDARRAISYQFARLLRRIVCGFDFGDCRVDDRQLDLRSRPILQGHRIHVGSQNRIVLADLLEVHHAYDYDRNSRISRRHLEAADLSRQGLLHETVRSWLGNLIVWLATAASLGGLCDQQAASRLFHVGELRFGLHFQGFSQDYSNISQRARKAFQPADNWGPSDIDTSKTFKGKTFENAFKLSYVVLQWSVIRNTPNRGKVRKDDSETTLEIQACRILLMRDSL